MELLSNTEVVALASDASCATDLLRMQRTYNDLIAGGVENGKKLVLYLNHCLSFEERNVISPEREFCGRTLDFIRNNPRGDDYLERLPEISKDLDFISQNARLSISKDVLERAKKVDNYFFAFSQGLLPYVR